MNPSLGTEGAIHIPEPCMGEIKYLHVDDNFLVIDKPAGLLSIPGRYVRDSVLHRVFFEYPDVRIVHRLDLGTSGVMVLARSKAAAADLSRQFRARMVQKQYIAVVAGRLANAEGEIDAPLAADRRDKPRHRVDHTAGKHAVTRYCVIDVMGATTRLLLEPQTGRSHQLRVHLASIGHPILGCDLYGDARTLAATDRLMLHAARLTLAHPATGEMLTFDSAPPF